MRDGEIAAEALGHRSPQYKALAFAVSGFCAGRRGLYCAVLNFVSPEGFRSLPDDPAQAMVVSAGWARSSAPSSAPSSSSPCSRALREFKATQEIAFGALLLASCCSSPAAWSTC